VKDFKKAINEYSICLSLDAAYADAYLEKAKCYFLLGSTEKGFSSLKIFMEMNPDDVSIYKWIGDLLYEGMSYKDALKAYNELGEVDSL
jgi:tetratricopeptide (TPR) repeat protein